jgi:hypothetical protein
VGFLGNEIRNSRSVKVARYAATAVLASAVVTVLLTTCCVDSHRPGRSPGETTSKLNEIGALMKGLKTRHFDLSAVKDADELLDMACRAKILPGPLKDRLKIDGWGNRFVWQVCKASNDGTAVAVVSCGENGRFEWGGGDDMVFRLELLGGSTPAENGR